MSSTRKTRIALFIESNPEDILIVQDFLSVGGSKMRMISVSSIEKAVSVLETEKIDVILLDSTEINEKNIEYLIGIQTRWDKLTFIVITAFENRWLSKNFAKLSIRYFLYKHSLNSDILMNTIESAIENQELLNQLNLRQKELEESETRFRMIVEKSMNGILILNKSGEIEYLNPYAEKIFGSKDQPDFSEINVDFLEVAARTETQEIKISRNSHKTVLESNSVEIPWHNDTAHLVVFKDVTERKQYEEVLKNTLEKLETSNKELEQFAYAISHDLNEPLRSITGYIQLIAKKYQDKLDEQGSHIIKRIESSAVRLQNMIGNILEYSRVTTNPGETKKVNLNDVMNDVLANLEMKITECQPEITWDHLPNVVCKPMQIMRVFQNLISNAMKFRGKTPPKIHISSRKLGNEFEFSVRDNGIGIEKTHFERIFMLFQRLHGRDEYPGTGVGLAVCKRIIESHGGKIWLKSKVGQGTTIYFTIPTIKEEKQI